MLNLKEKKLKNIMTEIKKKYSTFEQSKINFQLRHSQKI